MNRRWNFFVGAVIVSCVHSLAFDRISSAKDSPKDDGPANAASKSVYDEAMRILNGIQATKYVHVTDIDEKEGRYYCDCSGFVGYVSIAR